MIISLVMYKTKYDCSCHKIMFPNIEYLLCHLLFNGYSQSINGFLIIINYFAFRKSSS